MPWEVQDYVPRQWINPVQAFSTRHLSTVLEETTGICGLGAADTGCHVRG